MTLGTSPQWGILSRSGPENVAARAGQLWQCAGTALRGRWYALAQWAAVLHLGALALVATMGWHDPDAAGGAAIGGLQAGHLAFLLATGAATAALTLMNGRPEVPDRDLPRPHSAPCVDQLLAQMSHELRTPLNAMIGFSEVMLRELYGPLGNARYQEYAAHISHSGGQLLRSAEDALAVTETMSAVMADRLAARCERVTASTLVREAWSGLGVLNSNLKLSVTNCAPCDIPCERRATVQALQHLLREAAGRGESHQTIEVRGRRRDGARSIVISIAPSAGAAEHLASVPAAQPQGYPPANVSLRVMLARLLVEMQGGSLSFWEGEAGSWSVCIAFAPRA